MNALSIVMVSLASTLVVITTLVIIALVVMKKVFEGKRRDFEVLNKYAPPHPIVFLGDSLTNFYPVQEFFHDDRMVNRGIADETTSEIFKRIDEIAVLEPRAVFLLAGINNYVHSVKKVSADSVVSGIMEIAEKLRTFSKEVYVLSLYPVNPKKRKFSKAYLRRATNGAVLQANVLIKNECKKRGFVYVDVHASLLNREGMLDENYTIEGLHLNYMGYEAVTAVLEDYVNKIE